MHERIATLIDRLYDKTKTKTLMWEKDPKGNFQISFPNYTVELSEDDEFNNWMHIHNEEGERVESISDRGLRGLGVPVSKFIELHEMARRIALGSDEAVESLIAALED